MTEPDTRSRNRSRLILLLVVAMFFSSFGIAAFLRFAGWMPAQSKNFGELLQPPRDLTAVQLTRADGTAYPWAPEKNTWRIVVVPADGCTTACVATIDTLHRVWLGQGRRADRIDVLWFGALPEGAPGFRKLIQMRSAPAVNAALPQAASVDAVPVYLVDPSGFLAMHYAPGFDPAGLRKDLGKLVK